jgi:hypothetical protein
MQSALGARVASLECAESTEGLVLQVRPTVDGPPLSIATVQALEHGVALAWTDTDQSMACSTSSSYEDLRALACGGAGVDLEAVTIRRLWP